MEYIQIYETEYHRHEGAAKAILNLVTSHNTILMESNSSHFSLQYEN